MLVAVIMGLSRSGPGRFTMRSRILRWRCRRISAVPFSGLLAVASWGLFRDNNITRNPPWLGRMRICYYLHYSKISGGFRAFSWISTRLTYISRLVKD